VKVEIDGKAILASSGVQLNIVEVTNIFHYIKYGKEENFEKLWIL